MFKLITLSLATAFTIYGLDEMKFINADDFDVAAAKINAFEQLNSEKSTEVHTAVASINQTEKVAIKHQRFTDRIANR